MRKRVGRVKFDAQLGVWSGVKKGLKKRRFTPMCTCLRYGRGGSKFLIVFFICIELLKEDSYFIEAIDWVGEKRGKMSRSILPSSKRDPSFDVHCSPQTSTTSCPFSFLTTNPIFCYWHSNLQETRQAIDGLLHQQQYPPSIMDRELDPALQNIITNAQNQYSSSSLFAQTTDRPHSGLSQRGFSAGARPNEFHQKYEPPRQAVNDIPGSSVDEFGTRFIRFCTSIRILNPHAKLS